MSDNYSLRLTWNKTDDQTAEIVCMRCSAIAYIRKKFMEEVNLIDHNKVKISIKLGSIRDKQAKNPIDSATSRSKTCAKILPTTT